MSTECGSLLETYRTLLLLLVIEIALLLVFLFLRLLEFPSRPSGFMVPMRLIPEL
jgi:hypothetical protein